MPETWVFSYQYNIYKLPQNSEYYVGQTVARTKQHKSGDNVKDV
jgi:hypothetical protein